MERVGVGVCSVRAAARIIRGGVVAGAGGVGGEELVVGVDDSTRW